MRKTFVLLGICLLLGLVSLYSLVHFSQKYLSEELTIKSKDKLKHHDINFSQLQEHLGDTRLANIEKHYNQITLSFWSTECAPCLKKLPTLTADKKQLLVPINTDMPEQLELAESLFKTLAPKGLPFLHDGGRRLTKEFLVDFLPTHITFDTKGQVIDYQVGLNAPLRKERSL